MHEKVEKLLGQVIISCQAYEGTPLFGSESMKKMAESAILGKAIAVRACWPSDIQAIRSISDDLIIVGINKVIKSSDSTSINSIVITPDLDSVSSIVEAGADIIALDCTIREFRNEEALLELLKSIKEKYPDIAIMADCETLEECIFAESTGLVDIVSNTLSTMRKKVKEFDYELVKKIKESVSIPVNAEGNIWSVEDLKKAVSAGADMVTIGSAVTRPQLITERFVDYNDEYRK